MIAFVLVGLTILGACQGFTFVISPSNSSGIIGQTGTIPCIVSNLGSDTFSWKKKQTTGTGYDTISVGNTITGSQTKYSLAGTYNLTIMNVASTDAGLYQCSVGATAIDVSFTPVILPTNLSVYWENSPRSGSTVNITCRATYGSPAPTNLKWFRNTGIMDVELTNFAYYYTENVRSSGYGDAVSTLALALNSDYQNQNIRCEAAYDGLERAMEYTLTVQLSGGQSIKAHGILAALFVAASMVFRQM